MSRLLLIQESNCQFSSEVGVLEPEQPMAASRWRGTLTACGRASKTWWISCWAGAATHNSPTPPGGRACQHLPQSSSRALRADQGLVGKPYYLFPIGAPATAVEYLTVPLWNSLQIETVHHIAPSTQLLRGWGVGGMLPRDF